MNLRTQLAALEKKAAAIERPLGGPNCSHSRVEIVSVKYGEGPPPPCPHCGFQPIGLVDPYSYPEGMPPRACPVIP